MARLSGWQEISDYTRRSEKVVREWQRNLNFPVVKLGACIESDTDLIDKWLKRQIEKGLESQP